MRSLRPALLLPLLLVIASRAPLRGEGAKRPRDLGPAPTSIHVRDDDDALNDLLDRAAEAAEKGEFTRAAQLYQEAAESTTSQVRRVAARTYLGVREFVKTRIALWPEEGRKAYRKLTDTRAAEFAGSSIAAARPRRLEDLVRRFPLSSYGPPAMLALGTRALARGDYDSALRRFLEILHLHPEGEIPGVRRADVVARSAVAAAKRGDRLLLEEMRSRAKDLDPEALVGVAGKEVSLASLLAGLEPAAAGSLAPAGWTSVGGCSSRTGGRSGPEGPLVLYWAAEIVDHGEEDPLAEPPHSPLLPVHPLIADGQILVIGHSSLTGLPLPPDDFVPTPSSIAELHPEPIWSFPPAGGGGDLNSRIGQPPAFGTAGDGVLALPFREADLGPLAYGTEIEKSTFLTLGLSQEGRLLDQRGGIDPLHQDEFEGVVFCGAPVVRSGRVYVCATRKTHRVETLVYAFELPALRPVWKTSVCLGGKVERDDFPGEYGPRIDSSSLAMRNGVLFLCSNTGAVAALEAVSGQILWVHAYERAKAPPSLFPRPLRDTRTWFPNPPLLDHRFLYATPLDSEMLFVYFQRPDLATGFVEHARIGRNGVVKGFNPEYLVGVRDGVAFLAGRTRNRVESPLFAVKAGPEFAAEPGRPGDPTRIRWRAEIEEDEPHGRGLLAGDSLYFPTAKAIYRVAAADGSVEKLVDASAPGIRERVGRRKITGNLAVAGRWLVSASHELVCLFGPAPREKEEPEKGE